MVRFILKFAFFRYTWYNVLVPKGKVLLYNEKGECLENTQIYVHIYSIDDIII